MDYVSYGFNAISSLFIYGAIILFLHCFYDTHFQWNWKKFLLLSAWSLLTAFAAYDFWEEHWLAAILLDLVVTSIIVFYDYSGKKLRGFFRFFWMYLLCSLSLSQIILASASSLLPSYLYDPNYLESLSEEAILDLFISLEWYDSIINLYVVVPCALFFCSVFFYLYYRLYRPGIFIPCGKRERIFGWIYSLVFFTLSVFLSFSGGQDQLSRLIFSFSFLLLAALIPIFIYYSRISGYYRQRTKYQEDFMEVELEHFRQYKLAQEETRRFRHDVKNDLLCIHELLTSGKAEEAGAYLKNLVEITDALGSRHVTGDEILDSILAAKGAVMEEKDITFSLDGVLAGGLPWKPVDICSVFANGLDNAIEACSQLPAEERSISMKIKSTPQFWFIRIENPVKEDIDVGMLFQKKGGYTSKSDARHHGIGTYSIKHTAETYGGIVNARCADRRFTLEIMLAQ